MSTMESHMMLMAEGFCFMQALRFVFAEISRLPRSSRAQHRRRGGGSRLIRVPYHTQNIA
jgi:hypothetical protein